jgi:hypothetical protein
LKKIPGSITIRGIKWRVLTVDPADFDRIVGDSGFDSPGKKMQGFLDQDGEIIYLSDRLSRDVAANVFWHEVAHIIEWICGADWSESDIENIASILRELN